MKVINLLNKIANGEEVPKDIRYFNKNENEKMVMLADKENIIYRLNQEDIDLTDEIETTEEDEKIEYIPMLKDDNFKTRLAINQTRRKINEIIEELNRRE